MKYFPLVVCVLFLLCSCDKIFPGKKVDYRESYIGYYNAKITDLVVSATPEPPSGVVNEEQKEIQVKKGSTDSSIIFNDIELKLASNGTYYKSDDYGSTVYNYTRLSFYTKDKKDSVIFERSSGSASLIEVRRIEGAFVRK